MRNLYEMRAGRKTINNRLFSRGYRAYRPTRSPLLTANCWSLRLKWAQRWQNLTMAHRWHVIFSDKSRFQLYSVDGRLKIRRIPGERSSKGARLIGSKLVVVRYTFGDLSSDAKSPLVLSDRHLNGELYRSILWNTLVPFGRKYFEENYGYRDGNATPHHARVDLDFFQQGNVTMMKQPAWSPDSKSTKHIWDELGHAITSIDNPPQNLGELHQALLDRWAEIPVEHLQRLVASMPRRLEAIIVSRGGNTWYSSGIHKTTPTASIMQKKIKSSIKSN